MGFIVGIDIAKDKIDICLLDVNGAEGATVDKSKIHPAYFRCQSQKVRPDESTTTISMGEEDEQGVARSKPPFSGKCGGI